VKIALLLSNVFIVFFLPIISYSLDDAKERAGLLFFSNTDVFVDGKQVDAPVSYYSKIADGTIVRTGTGRVEIQLGAGTILRMDNKTQLQMKDSFVENLLIKFERGTIFVETFYQIKHHKIRIQFGDCLITFDRCGLYRLDAQSSQLRVYDGKAETECGRNKVSLKKGKTANLNKLTVSKLDPGQKDTFHRWAAKRSYDHFVQAGDSNPWKNWKPLLGGYIGNSGYGLAFFSEELFQKQEEQLRKERNKIIIPLY
jgi:hypothetical protein